MKRFLRATLLWIVALPWAIYGLGIASNQVVLIANGGSFPVLASDLHFDVLQKDDEHIRMTTKTHLNALADIFLIHGVGVESVGDALQDLAEWLWSFAPFVWIGALGHKIASKGLTDEQARP
jgi:hypothetical protein